MTSGAFLHEQSNSFFFINLAERAKYRTVNLIDTSTVQAATRLAADS